MSQLPSTIDAVVITKTGPDYDGLTKMTLPFPQPHPYNVIIKVEYMGVNFTDAYYRQGLYPVEKFPAIIGKEASGTVVALPTDPQLLNDPKFKRRGYTIGSPVVVVDSLGAHASYISIPWIKVHPLPPSISLRTAAATALQAITAASFLEESYNVQKGDIILIHTIAGGVGLLMCQIAKHRGATVIGTTSTEEKAELARSNGADHVILYPKEDTVARVFEITNNEGVHAVFDGVGKDTFDANFKLLRRKGTLVSLGNASGSVPPFAPIRLVEKNLKLLRPTMSNYTATSDEVDYYGTMVFDLVERGILKILIFKEYPFTREDVIQAQKDLTQRGGKTVGKLLIKVEPELQSKY